MVGPVVLSHTSSAFAGVRTTKFTILPKVSTRTGIAYPFKAERVLSLASARIAESL